MSAKLEPADVARLQRCVEEGGVAVFPSDTVYGICCDPESESAASKLYALKGRAAARACAVMFFAIEPALAALDELAERERLAMNALLPGPVTLLLHNPRRRFAPACRADRDTFGLRVPRLPEPLAALHALAVPVMQSSANLSGEPDARVLADVPARLREGADLVLDGGELPGTPSTVVDLRDFGAEGRWHVLREGALARTAVDEALKVL